LKAHYRGELEFAGARDDCSACRIDEFVETFVRHRSSWSSLNRLRRSHIVDMKHGAVVACVVDLFLIRAVSSELMVYMGTANARVFHSDTKKLTRQQVVPITRFLCH